jgi:hypothetical protein
VRAARYALAILGVAAVCLLVLEIGFGGLGYGRVALGDPCDREGGFEGGGLDGALQGVTLYALDRAACELGTTREELVLSLADTGKQAVAVAERIRDALREAFEAGFENLVAAGGVVGELAARLFRAVIESAPIDWLLGDGG